MTSRIQHIEQQLSSMDELTRCFGNRKWFCEKPGHKYLCLTLNQPVRYSRRQYKLWFLFDLSDFTLSVVIDNRAFWGRGQWQCLATIQEQFGLNAYFSQPHVASILAWLKVLEIPNQDTQLNLTFAYKRKNPSHINILADQLKPFADGVSGVRQNQVLALPWVRSFLNQFKAFQSEVLNRRLIFERGGGDIKRLTQCTELLTAFLDEYNSRDIPLFPFFGESPKSYKRLEIVKIMTNLRVTSTQQLLRLRDRKRPILAPLSIDDAMEYAKQLTSEESLETGEDDTQTGVRATVLPESINQNKQ